MRTSWNKGLKIDRDKYPTMGNRKPSFQKKCGKCGKLLILPPSLMRIKFCSRKCYGEYRKTNIVGINHYQWRGDNVSYSGLHHWIKKQLGSPSECAYCGNEGRIEWASISHKAKRDLEDYIPLCARCHRTYDNNMPINAAIRDWRLANI